MCIVKVIRLKCSIRKTLLVLALSKKLLASCSSYYVRPTTLNTNDIVRVVSVRTALDADSKCDCTKIVISFSKKSSINNNLARISNVWTQVRLQ